ncbi:MAG: hypothetical protein U0800_10755 [Isosphaeraceae bacterium]
MQADSGVPSPSRIDVLKSLIGRLSRPEITLAEARAAREELGRLLDLGAIRPQRDGESLGPVA